MAPFNPDIKDVSPVNPIGWSHPAQVPDSFASALSAGIKGAGELVTDTVKAADELVKDSAKKAVEDKIIPERDDYIAQLAGADFSAKFNAAAGQATPLTPGIGPGTPITKGIINLGTDEEKPAPAELKALPNTLSLWDSARANGKISETDYYGRLMTIASDLRSRYPVGYREYIDHQISKITGVDPANAYIKSIIGDINSFATNAQAERNRTVTEMMKFIGADPVNGAAMIDGVARGHIPPVVGLNWAAKFAAIEYKNKQAVDALHLEDMNQKEKAARADRTFSQYTSSTMAEVMATAAEREGMGPAQINRILTDQLQGKAPSLTTIQHEALAQYLVGIRQTMSTQFRAELNKTDSDKDSKTYRPESHASILKTRGNEIIKEALQPLDDMIDLVHDKRYGLAFNTLNLQRALKDDFAAQLLKNPTYAQQALYANAVKSMYGETALTQAFMVSAGLGQLPTAQSLNVQNIVTNLVTPPDPRGRDFKDYNSPGEVLRRTQAFELKNNMPLPGTYEQVRNRVYGPTLSILNPNTGTPEGDIRLIKEVGYKFFSPETRGFLKLIKPDQRDEKGRMQEGVETWFAGFSQPEVARAIAKTGDATLLDHYHDSIKTDFYSIFKNRIISLGRIGEEGGQQALGGAVKASPYLLSWNDKTVQLEVGPRPGVALTRSQSGALDNIRDEVTAVNKGIKGLWNSYQGQGKTEAEVQGEILSSLNFELKAYRSMNGLPENLKLLMEQKYKQQQEEEAALKASKKKFQQ